MLDALVSLGSIVEDPITDMTFDMLAASFLFVMTAGSFTYTFLKTNRQATKDDVTEVKQSLARMESRMDDVYKLVAANGRSAARRMKKKGRD